MNMLLALHPPNTYCPYSNSLLNFQPNSNLELFMDVFRSVFWCMFHLWTTSLCSMVLEHFLDFFNPKDSANGFFWLHPLCSCVAVSHIYGYVVRAFGANWLLALTKPFGGICLIIVKKTLYWLMNKTLCL